MGWMPDGHGLWFLSERDGYMHLYVVDAAEPGAAAVQRPSGAFEVMSAEVSRDKTKFYLVTNEAHPGERHLYETPIGGGPRLRLTAMTGSSTGEVSPDGAFVAAQFSGRPWMLYPVAGGEPRPIPSLEPHDEVLPWTVDPGWLLVQAAGQMPARIHRIDLATGHREPWREVAPPDATGVYSVRGFRFARDEQTCGYTYTIQLDDLDLVEGLR